MVQLHAVFRVVFFFLAYEHMFSLGKTCCVAVSFGYASLSIMAGLLERAYESSGTNSVLASD